MFSIGIKPDDCRYEIETVGKKGNLYYVEYFNIPKNIITDRYIKDTYEGLNSLIESMNTPNDILELKTSYNDEKERYEIEVIAQSSKTAIYLSAISEMLGQIGNKAVDEIFNNIASQLKEMFTGDFIEHKHVKEAIEYYIDELKPDLDEDEFNDLYYKILIKAVENARFKDVAKSKKVG